MSTFQAVIYSIVHGFSEFLPISSSAHHLLIPYLLNWPAPTGPIQGAFALGAFLAVLVYFRHDWVAMLSSALQVVIFRKKPMTVDERMPFFLLIASIPSIVVWYYSRESMDAMEWSPLVVAGLLAAFALPLWFFDYMSRKNRSFYDWNSVNSGISGLGQIALIIPGGGRVCGGLIGAMLRNYSREAAVKFILLGSLPPLLGRTIFELRMTNFHAPVPAMDLSWLSYATSVVVTFFTGLLAIGGFLKYAQKKGFNQYVAYRLVLAAVACGIYWYRNS